MLHICNENIYFYLLARRGCHTKQLKDQTPNAQKIRSGEIASRIFETYKNYVKPNGCHIHTTESDTAMATICTCTSLHHEIPHCIRVLHREAASTSEIWGGNRIEVHREGKKTIQNTVGTGGTGGLEIV